MKLGTSNDEAYNWLLNPAIASSRETLLVMLWLQC